jgi:hypothetical protein
MQRRRQLAVVGVSLLVLFVWAGPIVHAQSSSPNYKIEESFFGTGGELDASSPNYRAKQAAGETVVGRSASGNYQFYGGFNTTDTPLLEFAVDGGTYDLGVLDSGNTSSVAASFGIRNYLSSGYIVTVNGESPTLSDGGHTLAPMSSPSGVTPGEEQFGINLVDNSIPDVGANPVYFPDNTFSYGTAVAGYDTPNIFQFNDGATIGMSPRSSGLTTYTLSIVANVARETPAGQYGGRLNVQVVPTF